MEIRMKREGSFPSMSAESFLAEGKRNGMEEINESSKFEKEKIKKVADV